jgi:hypothetical protein
LGSKMEDRAVGESRRAPLKGPFARCESIS